MVTQLPRRFVYLIFRELKRLLKWTPKSFIFDVIYKVFIRFGFNVFLGFFLARASKLDPKTSKMDPKACPKWFGARRNETNPKKNMRASRTVFLRFCVPFF